MTWAEVVTSATDCAITKRCPRCGCMDSIARYCPHCGGVVVKPLISTSIVLMAFFGLLAFIIVFGLLTVI